MITTKNNTLLTAAVAVSMGLAAPVTAQTLDVAWSQDATGLDPHTQTAFASIRLLELLYEPLVRLGPNLEILPAVAESWEFSEDATRLTFRLDPEARFHDDSQVTAADVKASFERILDESTGATARANYASITAIETPDDQTVVFQLGGPDVPILNGLASINAAIVPASAINAGDVGTEVVGSGPFTLESRTPNANASLSVHEDWHGGEVSYDGIEISILPDETAILATLRTGQTDFAFLTDPQVATLVPRSSNVELVTAPSLDYHVLQLNAAREPMGKTAVRQAISCALDRQDILDAALLGEGQVTGPLTSPAYRNDPSSLFCYEQDQELARQLLIDAGYENGFSATIMAANGEPPTAATEAQLIQSQLAEVGINLSIEMKEMNVYIDSWLNGDFDMAMALNGGRVDPYTMYSRYWTKDGDLQHVANYIDETLDTLMRQGQTEPDAAARKDIFAEFERHLVEMAPWVWLYTGYSYAVQGEGVEGFEATPTGSLFGLVNLTLSE